MNSIAMLEYEQLWASILSVEYSTDVGESVPVLDTALTVQKYHIHGSNQDVERLMPCRPGGREKIVGKVGLPWVTLGREGTTELNLGWGTGKGRG